MADRRVFLMVNILVSATVGQKTIDTLEDVVQTFFNTNDTQTAENRRNELIKSIFYTNETPPNTTIFNSVPSWTTSARPSQLTIAGQVPTPYKSCGLQKECVPRLLCKDKQITKSGIGVINIRFGGADCEYLHICCDISDKTTEPIIPIKPPVQHEGCGYRNPEGVGYRIIGDEHNETQFAEFPWMVAILSGEQVAADVLSLYKCGGALIAPTVVLTAGHCVHNRQAEVLVVRAGEWDMQTKSESLPHQDRRVKKIIVHERFDKDVLFNDIALLFVDIPFQLAENVRPICLPEPNAIFEYSRCFATGWGKKKFGPEGAYQAILKKIELPVVPVGQCQSNLRTTRLGEYFELHPSFICAGGEKDKDTCQGDGGSPLVCPVPGVKDRFYHAGIVAWGIGCGQENIPGVYGSVAYLRQWLNYKLKQNGINFNYFTL